MPVPTNISAETALVVTTLPYAITVDAFEVPSDGLWWRFDKTAGGATILGLASPVPLETGTYVPRVDAYTGTPGALDPYLNILAIAVPFTTPLDSVITSYYFRVINTAGAFTEQLRFELIEGPVAAAPAGSFAINDDTDGFPMAIVSSTDGSVLQSFAFPAGERAGMLPTGESLWHDQPNKTAKLYSAQFDLIATVEWSALADHDNTPEAPISASDTLLYLADVGRFTGTPRNAQVTTVDAAGALGATVWDLGAYFVWAIAPSRDDAVLYYVNNSSNAAIKRWDLALNTAMSDLVAAPGAGIGNLRDLLVLADGSIVAGYKPVGSAYVRRFDAAGATLNTYTFTSINRLAHAGDGTSFWVWWFPETGTSRFERIRASDGVVLETVDSPNASGGVWLGASPGAPEEAHSTSCPFLLTPEDLPGVTVPPPASVVVRTREIPIRRLRRAPHLSDEQKWLYYSQLTIDLEAGVGLASGQGSDPLVMVRWSDDGGHTWSNLVTVSAGRIGDYRARAIVRRLGRSRDRVFEVSVSDPVRWFLVDAFLELERGLS